MNFWYAVLAVAIVSALLFTFDAGRIVGVLEYRADNPCVEKTK